MISIHFSLYLNTMVKCDCTDEGLLRDIEQLLTHHKKGYMFSPKFKCGVWDGKISLFKKVTRTFPYGLLIDVVKHIKKEWSDVAITLAPEVREMFGVGASIDYEYNLKHKPYPYQQDVVEIMLKMTKGIAIVATAGGKSLIISYMITNIPLENNKTLIIVPTLQLVDQFKSDMIDYGFNENIIGSVNSKKKEFDKEVVVSTWQSLKNQTDKLDMFTTVICDEVHTAAAKTIGDILMNMNNAKYRFGVTGTLPDNPLDEMMVKSYLGPVLRTYTGKDLADLGYVSKCVIKQLHIKYNRDYGKDYNIIRDEVFLSPFRMSVISGIITKSDNSVLVLVDRVEKEGMILEDYLVRKFPNREVVFISGKDKSNIRDEWRKEMNTKSNIICVATYGVFQQGVNIPSLREIILASSTKSFIRVIQSLGRTLRKHVSKEVGGAVLWDIVDDVKHLKEHGKKRYSHYVKEKHVITENTVQER